MSGQPPPNNPNYPPPYGHGNGGQQQYPSSSQVHQAQLQQAQLQQQAEAQAAAQLQAAQAQYFQAQARASAASEARAAAHYAAQVQRAEAMAQAQLQQMEQVEQAAQAAIALGTVSGGASVVAGAPVGVAPAAAAASNRSSKTTSGSSAGTSGSPKRETESEKEARLAKRRERDRKLREKKKAEEEEEEETAGAAAAGKSSNGDEEGGDGKKKAAKAKATPSKKKKAKKPAASGSEKKKKKPASKSGAGSKKKSSVAASSAPSLSKVPFVEGEGGVQRREWREAAPDLGSGWEVKWVERTTSSKGSKVRKDKSWFNRAGRHFKTHPEIAKYKSALAKASEETETDDNGATESDREEEAWAVVREMRRGMDAKRKSNGDDDGDKASSSSSTPKKAKKSPARKKAAGDDDDTSAGTSPAAASAKTPTKAEAAKKKKWDGTPVSYAKVSAAASKSGKPKYVDMVHDAIRELKDRTGSSVPAIMKFMLQEHAHLKELDEKKFRSSITTAIKAGIKAERFKKEKGSYKINQEWVKKEKAKQRAKEAEARKKEKARKKELEKKKKVENAKSSKEKAALDKKRKAEAERLRKEREAEAERQRIANMTPEEKAEFERKKAAALARKRAKEEADRQEKIRLERIKKRKFPMDDFELMAEDEELKVKPPQESRNFPKMPYVMQAVIPHDARIGGRVADSIRSASQVNSLEDGSRGLISDMMQVFHFFNGDVGYARANPDVVPPFTLTNLLYAADEMMKGNSKVARALPPLISHLFVVSLRILTKSNGHKGSIIGDEREDEDGLSPEENRLRDDLLKLGEGLNVISWPAICTYYMDAMERFFTTDATSDDNFLPNMVRYSADHFEPDDEDDAEEINGEESSDEEELEPMQLDEDGAEGGGLPDGYSAYLGLPGCSLYKAFDKLSRSEPWNLTAEDVFALLRALTDDILSNDPELARKINDGGSELYELSKQKRFADIHLKRVRNAIKDKERKEAAAEAAEKAAAEKKEKEEAEKKGDVEDGGDDTKKEEDTGDKKPAEPAEDEPPKKDEGDEKPSAKDDDGDEKKKKRVGAKKWAVPKATQRELNAAEKDAKKKYETYEKALKEKALRTDPVGYDRYQNPIFFFHHDPDRLYLEITKDAPTTYAIDPSLPHLAKTWFTIDSKSLFDSYLECLDDRGKREDDLYDDLTGTAIRRYLYDDVAKEAAIRSKKRELENLEKKLANAQNKCDAEQGRRSGRIASTAVSELSMVQNEIDAVKAEISGNNVKVEVDYRDLTGLDMLNELERSAKKKTRELSRLGAAGAGNELQPQDICGYLWNGGRGQGALGLVVDSLLETEEHCEALVPWRRTDMARDEWIANLKEIVTTWKRGNLLILGPDNEEDKEDYETPVNVSQLVSQLKKPLLELEERVFTITGHAMKEEAFEEAERYADAHENDDDDDDEDEREKAELGWKKKVYSLTNIPVKRAAIIRDVIISAIAIARKAHLQGPLEDLRAALAEHRPTGANKAKLMALEALERHGGYVPDDDESDDEEDDDGMEIDNDGEDQGEQAMKKVETLLCDDANRIFASIKEEDNTSRDEWIEGVKACKHLPVFAAFVEGLAFKGDTLLLDMENERTHLNDALKYWDSAAGKKSRGSTKKLKYDSSSPVWTDYEPTQEFVWAKVEGYPWWPSRICNAKDKEIDQQLRVVQRKLISFVGMEDISCVDAEDEIKPYCGETSPVDEDTTAYPEKTMEELKRCLTMTRRILKGRGVIQATPMQKNKSRSRMEYLEEEKKLEVS